MASVVTHAMAKVIVHGLVYNKKNPILGTESHGCANIALDNVLQLNIGYAASVHVGVDTACNMHTVQCTGCTVHSLQCVAYDVRRGAMYGIGTAVSVRFAQCGVWCAVC